MKCASYESEKSSQNKYASENTKSIILNLSQYYNNLNDSELGAKEQVRREREEEREEEGEMKGLRGRKRKEREKREREGGRGSW